MLLSCANLPTKTKGNTPPPAARRAITSTAGSAAQVASAGSAQKERETPRDATTCACASSGLVAPLCNDVVKGAIAHGDPHLEYRLEPQHMHPPVLWHLHHCLRHEGRKGRDRGRPSATTHERVETRALHACKVGRTDLGLVAAATRASHAERDKRQVRRRRQRVDAVAGGVCPARERRVSREGWAHHQHRVARGNKVAHVAGDSDRGAVHLRPPRVGHVGYPGRRGLGCRRRRRHLRGARGGEREMAIPLGSVTGGRLTLGHGRG
eukprot:scaffold16934_cov80-Phaeocystis_antarctica.AAC.1